MVNFNEYPNFSRVEFDSPDKPGSGKDMKESFMKMLQQARTVASGIGMQYGLDDVPFHVISGVRTPEYNKKVGGVDDSSHPRGYAADIECGSRERFIIVNALLIVGFTRIGINHESVHVDNDPDKPEAVIWDYYG